MALVRRLREIEKEGSGIHGEVEAAYFIFTDSAGGQVLQIETYGSPNRRIPGKISQSIQFDQDGIEALAAVLNRMRLDNTNRARP